MKKSTTVCSFVAIVLCLCLLIGCGQGEAPEGNQSDHSDDISTSATSTTGDNKSDPQSSTTQKEMTKVTSSTTTTTKPPVLTKKQFAFSTPGLPSTKSKELLKNPDRGFRLELYVNAADGKWLLADGGKRPAVECTQDQLDQYASDSPQLAQTYVYLTDYYNKDLDRTALDNIQKYFDFLDSKGIRMLLRFAYEHDENDKVHGPSTEQVLRHLEQLKPLLEKNKNKIYVMQAGCIGLWGEWHHSLNIPASDYKKVLEAIVDATPKELFVQVRMVSYKNLLDKNDPRRERVGYHDDYLVGVKNSWNTGLVPGMEEWEQETAESPYVLTDGEMPWGSDTSFVQHVDSYLMAKRLNLHCFGSLSLAHHYKEGGRSYSMEKWKSEVTSAKKLNGEGLPYAPSWFTDESGKTVDRSMFAYIRDYLGYYLEASQVKAKIDGKKLRVDLQLTNYGFAAPLSMKQPELVLIDKNGKVVSAATICKTVDLQTKRAVSATVELKLPADPYGAAVGIRFTNPMGTPARIANDIEYVNGINILGRLVN